MNYQKLKSKSNFYLIDLPKKSGDIIVEIYFPAGYFYAPDNKKEIAHLLEHYLYNCIEEAGFDGFASTNINTIAVYSIFDKKNLQKELPEFLNVILNNPISNEAIFNKQKKILHNELVGILNDPEELSYRLVLNNRVLNQQPFTVRSEDYSEITFSDLADYYQKQCTPAGVSVFIGCHNPTEDLQKQIEEVVSGLSIRKELPAISEEKAKYELSKFAIKQYQLPHGRTDLNISWPAPASLADVKEQMAFMLIYDLLIDQDKGLLWDTLRDGLGLTYDINGHIENYRNFGQLCVSVAVLSENLEESISVVLDQIERIKNQDYPDDLLKKCIKDTIRSNKEEWGGNTGRFYWIIVDILERNKSYSLEEWLVILKEIDEDYLSEMANKYLNSEDINLTLIGDEIEESRIKNIEKSIKKD